MALLETARFNIPLLAAGQAHKELFHNEALARIDFLLHPIVQAIETDPAAIVPVAGHAARCSNASQVVNLCRIGKPFRSLPGIVAFVRRDRRSGRGKRHRRRGPGRDRIDSACFDSERDSIFRFLKAWRHSNWH